MPRELPGRYADLLREPIFLKKCLTQRIDLCYTTRAKSFRSFFYAQKMNGGDVMRTKITLECTECKQRNYDTTKEKRNHPDRMETKKYCRFCRKHTLHKETK